MLHEIGVCPFCDRVRKDSADRFEREVQLGMVGHSKEGSVRS